MSTPATIESSKAISIIAEEIVREHEAAQGAFRSAVEHAVRCGKLLTEAKGQVDHGAWLPWVEENFPASRRTAQGYMRLAARYPNAQLPADMTIDGALKQLAAPRDDRDPGYDRLDRAKEHIAAADDCYQRAFEEFAERGVRFHATGAEFPDDLTFEEWRQVGQFLAALPVLEALSPAARWDIEDALGEVRDAVRGRDADLLKLRRDVDGALSLHPSSEEGE